MNPWNLLLSLLGNIVAFFYSVIPNYGVAIILLTLLISFLLFPLTLKQTRSMRAMQEIQPEVKRLQKELKGDREELNKQLMALYQERGVNPAAGCLPLLLQMPIWFALFRVLRVQFDDAGVLTTPGIPADSQLAADLTRDAAGNFFGMDMLVSPSSAASSGITHAIPYIVLILIVVAAGFYQQFQTTRTRSQSPQTQQQQSMQTAMKILPVFFGFISWGFPTGLVLYFATSNLFRIGQQALIIRLDERHQAEADRPPSKQPPGASGNGTEEQEPPPRSGPSPHTSKKRKKRRRK